MSENLRKLIGVALMAAIVVVGIVATNDNDSDFTRNAAFIKLGDIKGDFKDDGGGKNEEIVFESKRRNVLALGGDSVASVIVGDNHFRDVGDPTSALKKLADTAEPLVGEDLGLGVRGPLSKLVDKEFPQILRHLGTPYSEPLQLYATPSPVRVPPDIESTCTDTDPQQRPRDTAGMTTNL